MGSAPETFVKYPFLKYWPERKTFSFMTFPTDRWSYKKKMDDMQQLFDSEGCIIFSNKHTNFETLTKLQNLTLYITNRTFLYNTANLSIENAFFIILTCLSLIEKKLEQFSQKKNRRIFCVSELHISKVPFFEVLIWKQNIVDHSISHL